MSFAPVTRRNASVICIATNNDAILKVYKKAHNSICGRVMKIYGAPLSLHRGQPARIGNWRMAVRGQLRPQHHHASQ